MWYQCPQSSRCINEGTHDAISNSVTSRDTQVSGMASAGGKGKLFKNMNHAPSHCELLVNSAALGFWKGAGVGLQSSLNNPITNTLAPNLELLLISQSPLSSLGGQEKAAGSGNLGAWSLGRHQPHPDSPSRSPPGSAGPVLAYSSPCWGKV